MLHNLVSPASTGKLDFFIVLGLTNSNLNDNLLNLSIFLTERITDQQHLV